MGDTPQFGNSAEQAAESYEKHLPGILKATRDSILPTEQAIQTANEQLTPAKNDLSYKTLSDNYGRFTNVGADQAALASDRALGTTKDLLDKYGVGLGKSALAANEAADPYSAANRKRQTGALDTLFGSLDDPNKLSGSETAGIDRTLARSNIARGNEAPTASSTVESAMQFGDEGNKRKAAKQSSIKSAVDTATNAAGSLRSGIDATGLVKSGQAGNIGMGFMPGVANAGDREFGFGSNALSGFNAGAIAGQNNTSAHATSLMQDISGGVGIANSMCCFIFMEAYAGRIPWYVRASRDLHYTPQIRAGYVAMAKWLVPLMARFTFVRELVNELMIRPLTEDAAWVYSLKGARPRMGYKTFWLNLWKFIGRKTV